MTDQPITLRLRQPAPLMSLTGQKVSMWYDIQHETKKAILLAAVRKVDGMEFEAKTYWFAKSQILVDGKILPGKAVNEAFGAKVVRMDGWKWEQKKPAKPMGCK